jgi:hypothetical protein
MRIRLTDSEKAADLAAYCGTRGFFIVDRGQNEIDVHPLNHVSARTDAIRVAEVLDEWLAMEPGRAIDEPA